MSGALGGLGELNMELLRGNRFCIGVKRGGEYVCGGEADDDAKSNAIELLAEAVRRILRWRVWETWWIEETMDEWLEKRDRLEVQLRGKYSEEVINDLLGLVDKFIGYNERFLNYWRDVGSEVMRLVDDLINGRTEVIIRPSGISVYHERITLKVNKMSTGITVQLVLNGLEGMTIKVPDVFRKTMSRREYKKFIRKMLKALKGGFEETDGYVDKGYAAMGTTQIWQVIIWALLYPGEVYVLVSEINANEGSVTTKWHLRTSHKPLKGKLNDVEELGEEELLAFTLGAILGDGWADIEKVIANSRAYDEAVIEIGMSDERYKAWEQLFERLESMGFRSGKPDVNSNVVEVPFYGSNAIDLARAMIGVLPPILRDILDALSFEKWERIRRIAEMEMKFRRGEMQIDVAGYGFTVVVHKSTVELVHWARDEVEKDVVIDALRARYGDELAKYVRTHKSGKYLAIKISMYVFERYEDIKAQVIEVLCRKYHKVKDEEKKQIIIKHLMRLTAPTEGAAAVIVAVHNCDVSDGH